MAEQRPDELLLGELTDQLDRTRRLLTESPDDVARRALEATAGADHSASARITARLSDRRPLAHREGFLPAHRLTVHALEVLDGEGSNDPPVRGWWLLRPVLRFLIGFVADFVVQSYLQDVVGRMRTLYLRREVESTPGTEERRLLRLARADTDRLATTFTGGGRAGILLLAGGFAIPLLASAVNSFGSIPFSAVFVVIVLAAAIPVSFLASFVLLRGAAVAHRRSTLTMAAPLAALWETIGNCGDPPTDDADLFATIALVLTALFWLAIPGLGLLAYLAFA